VRSRGGLALLGVVALLVAGCGGLPIASGIRIERTVAPDTADQDAPDVHVLPPMPTAGSTPTDIVRGFLNAQADAENDYAIARDYLAPGTSWNTTGAVSVYAAAAYAIPAAQPRSTAVTSVAVTLMRTASLSASGVYAPQADQIADAFTLLLIRGQWRISAPPAGLQLTDGDLQRSYIPSTLWWLAPGTSLLVPEIRWLPADASGQQTELVRALLAGPSDTLARVVGTALPPGVTLEGSVSTNGPDVVVDLDQAAALLDAEQARLLLDQLALTLEPVSSGTGVRLEVGGQPVSIGNVPSELTFTAASAFDQDSPPVQAPTLALAAGRLIALSGTQSAPAAAALAGRALVSVVAAPTGGRTAAVVRVGTSEQVLVVDGDGVVQTVAGPGVYGMPSWSYTGTLIVPAGPDLLVLRPGVATPVRARYPGSIGTVTSARLARDGVRVLLVAGAAGASAAFVATLADSTGSPQLGAPVAVSTGLGTVLAAGWASSTTLALLVTPSGGAPELTQLNVDGSLGESVPLPAAVGTTGLTLAVAPGAGLLIGGGGLVEQLTGGSAWRPVAHASGAAAPS
jgi:hypothetical protein